MEDEFALPPHLKAEATYPSFAAGLQSRIDASKQTPKVGACLHRFAHVGEPSQSRTCAAEPQLLNPSQSARRTCRAA